MALERFIPKSPDPFIRNSQDFEVAKFGHLNTIIEYINSYVVTDSLQLAGSGPITSTARYITDFLGNASAISISTIGVGIGTNAPSEKLHVYNTAVADLYLKIQTTQSRTSGLISQNSTSNWFSGTQYSATNAYQVFDQTNNRLQLTLFNDGNSQFANTNTSLGAKLGIKGSGSTSATTSLLVQNSGATELLRVRDDGRVYIGTTGWFEPTAQSTSLYNFYSKPILTSTEGSNIVKVLISNNQHSFLSAAAGINGQIGINTSTPHASAALDITSTTTGVLFPRMTTAQRTAISSPAAGLVVFDTTLQNLCYYRDGVWVQATFTAA